MAVPGSTISVTVYNNLYNTIAPILGVGSGESGYGQVLASSPLVAGTVITAAQWDNLRTDLIKARVHQTNDTITDGTAIGSPWRQLKDINAGDPIIGSYDTQYLDFANAVASSKDSIATGQFSPAAAITGGVASRTTAWNGTVTTTATVTFAGYTVGSLTVSDADHARCFFNAGGKINITADRNGGATNNTKDTDWSNMLGLALKFGAASSSYTGTLYGAPTGTVNTGLGFRSLTVGAAATAFATQCGSGGTYTENRYTVTVSRPTAATLAFVITFADNDVGDGSGTEIDEDVTGLRSIITVDRPSGSSVDVPAPTCSHSNTTLA